MSTLDEREADTCKLIVKASRIRATLSNQLVNDSGMCARGNISQINGGSYRTFGITDFDIEALCKNRCMSSPGVIVLHMLPSGLEKRQPYAPIAATFSKLVRWHNDCALQS